MKDIDQVTEEIFLIIKNKKSVYYTDLYDIKDAERVIIELAWGRLTNDYELIRCKKNIFTVSKNGEKYKTVSEYLKSNKRKPIDKVALLSIIVTMVLGLLNIYQNYDYKELKSDYLSLEHQYDSLSAQSQFYKDSLSDMKYMLKQQEKMLLQDTLRTKN